jgi:prolyl oligopeptidase
LQPPKTRVETVREDHFGAVVDDPYRWMEDEGSPEFDAWLDGQARYAREFLDALPDRDAVYARLRGLRIGQGVRRHHVEVAGQRVFYLREDPRVGIPVLVVADTDPGVPERVLLDPTTLRDPAAAAHGSLDWYVPSPDGRYVACGVSVGGSERSTLRVIDVATGTPLPDAIAGVWFAFVSWCDDGDSLLYHQFLEPPTGTAPAARRLDSRSLRHRIGADPAIDEVLLARGMNTRVPLRPLDRPFLHRPPGSAWAIAIVSHGPLRPGRTAEALSACTMYVAPSAALDDPAGCPWRLVARPRDGVVAFAVGPDALYLVSHRGAAHRRVLAVPLAGGEPWQLVPESERVIEAIRVVGAHLLVRDLDGGVARLRRVPLAGGAPEEIGLPVDGATVEWATVPEPPGLLLGIESWISSARLYRYDAGAGTLVAARLALPSAGGGAEAGGTEADDAEAACFTADGGVAARPHVDPESCRVFAPARDGTAIPISLIHRRGLTRDGDNPVWLVGYGYHGVALMPGYEPYRLAWLERGGIWAVAHLRGGGEHGRAWHEAGRLLTKENTITDLIDCAEYLVARGYTRPGRLVGVGESGGGIAAGGALVRRPDLWAAMILQVPLVNSLRIEYAESGPIHLSELGSVRTEPGLRSLLISDVCHRVRTGTVYPPVLLTAGRNDSRVPAWQPAKLAAHLQAAASARPGGPTVLRIEDDAGHGFGSTAEQRDRERADAFAFALAAIVER